ncbi:hypothetical protein HNR74_004145 [Flammeovirga kamogawensis]|nr:hypothetical protein [Flammeovirga kamogawensis]
MLLSSDYVVTNIISMITFVEIIILLADKKALRAYENI